MTSDVQDKPAIIAAWLKDFAEEGLRPEEVKDFVARIDADIIASIPEIAADQTLIDELHASTREHWRNFLVGLQDEYRLALPAAAIALSLSIARRHHDISVLLKVYRVANKGTFRYLAEQTRADLLPVGLRRDEALLTLWERAEAWIDESVESLIDSFTQERAALTEGAQARRGELIDSLVAGDPPTAMTGRLLGHNLSQWQTAFVLSAPTELSAGDAGLYDVAVEVCNLLGLPRPLTTLAASRELWGWTATAERPEIDLAKAVTLVESAGLHLAVGRPARGPSAFRSAHLQAVAAQRFGAQGRRPCHDYDDIELVTLIGNSELAKDMVRREAGPLLGDARGYDTMRSTLLVYLQSGKRVETTAEALFVHPNTVRYRISRAEELLGYRISDRGTMLEVSLAWLDANGVSDLD